MNKNIINKIKLFFMGLESRLNENINTFNHINVEFSSGLKPFKGKLTLNDDNKLLLSFNGIKKTVSPSEFFTTILNECGNYDSLELTYSERGENLLISADNKNVSMKTIKNDDTASDNNTGSDSVSKQQTSSLLNRDYKIKVGPANQLLKELGIMSADGKIKNNKIRKYNQIDHYIELLDDILDTLPNNQIINILDCGCGKSYLSFVLNYYLTEVKRRKCQFIGIDHSETNISTCNSMAANLNYRNMEFICGDIGEYKPNKHIHMVLSLHACDTATDMALAMGIKCEADVIIAVPCCHKEMLSQYSYAPFKSILEYGVLKSRMADILTDGMRSLMLKAKGYEVSMVEYISPLETPKNLMIKAVKSNEEDMDSMTEYINLMSQLNVYPTLYALLNEWE